MEGNNESIINEKRKEYLRDIFDAICKQKPNLTKGGAHWLSEFIPRFERHGKFSNFKLENLKEILDLAVEDGLAELKELTLQNTPITDEGFKNLLKNNDLNSKKHTICLDYWNRCLEVSYQILKRNDILNVYKMDALKISTKLIKIPIFKKIYTENSKEIVDHVSRLFDQKLLLKQFINPLSSKEPLT